jgi:hypothetical protein
MYFVKPTVFSTDGAKGVINLNFNQHRRVTLINASRWRLEDAGEWKTSRILRWHRARGAHEYSPHSSRSRRQSATATGPFSQTRYLRRDVCDRVQYRAGANGQHTLHSRIRSEHLRPARRDSLSSASAAGRDRGDQGQEVCLRRPDCSKVPGPVRYQLRQR